MSDVYAFGMLILRTSPNFPFFLLMQLTTTVKIHYLIDVMTGKAPYYKCSTDPPIIMAIMSGRTPAPADYPELPSTDSYWDVMLACWNEDPNKRPTMAGLLNG